MRKKMRILLIENHRSFNEGALHKGLKQYGYTVDRLTESQTILCFIRTEIFDVILLDLNLNLLHQMF